MSTISGVYKITLKQDGRIYIGSSSNIEQRWVWHVNSSVQLIGKMIKKYGKDAFEFSILEECEPVKSILEQTEQRYLDELQPFPWNNNAGFNLSPTAYSCLGIKRSDETKQKMRDSWHMNRGEEFYKQLSERISGDKNPAKRDEVRKKISESRKGQIWKHDAERVEKHKKARLGKSQSEHWKSRMKETHLGSKRTEESKEKMSEWQQRTYELISPDGLIFVLKSKDLKNFCKLHNLGYSNLQQTSNTGKPYKGWVAKRLPK